MNKKKKITVNGKVKKLPQHLLKKNKFQKKKKGKKGGKNKHVKSKTITIQDPQLIAKQNLNSYGGQQHDHGDDYVSSDTSAEWFDGDEDSDSKAYGQGGYLRVRIGDRLNNRYIIESKLGWGHFSTVWLATDLLAPEKSSRRFVALKIQKSAPHYLDAAKDEVQLLSAAKQRTKDQSENYIVQMLDSFIVSASNGKHVVFVFEVLGENLLDLIKSYNYRGLPMAIVKKIAREVLLGLDYLHSHCDIIHTDLKPENVLISRTTSINIQQLEREKNRELKKQYERQLKRFEQQMENNNNVNSNHHNKLSKNQKKKLRQKINELKKNISNIDKKYIVLLRELSDERNEHKDNHNHNHNNHRNHHHNNNNHNHNGNSDNHHNHNNEYKKPLSPQFEFIHGRCISTMDDENNGKMYDASSTHLISPIAKICDLGNACWIDKHFTDDITTRQYRAPESILQVGYDTKVDIWSHACMIFELITGDYLFDPREKEQTKDDYGYSRDEDHLALIGELCGKIDSNQNIEYTPWPSKWTNTNDRRFNIKPNDSFDIYLKKLRSNIKRSGLVGQFFGGYKILKRDGNDIKWDFTRNGYQLSNIQKLDYWSLAAVLEEKYKIPHQKKSKKECKNATSGHEEARHGSLAHFLGRMLEIDPCKRATAKEMLQHQWLTITKQDVEECYKAECKWFKANGKPTTDTNANYGVSNKNKKNRNNTDEDDEEDVSTSDSLSDDDDDDDDEEDSTEDDDSQSEYDEDNRSRSRDSSVDARDEFANRRAESEPPVTWHKYLGIKWYEQFEEIGPYQTAEIDTMDDEEFNSKFDGLNINGIDEEEQYRHEVEMKQNHDNGYHAHNGHEGDDEDDGDDMDDDEEEEDLYQMDPDFDPHGEAIDNRMIDNYDSNEMFQEEDDESPISSDDDDDENNGIVPKRKVTLEITNEEEEDLTEQTPSGHHHEKTQENEQYLHYDEYYEENNNQYDGEDDKEIYEQRSSVIIHADGGGFMLDQLGIMEQIKDEPDQEEEDEEEDEDEDEVEVKQDMDKIFDSNQQRQNSSAQKFNLYTNPNTQPFFNDQEIKFYARDNHENDKNDNDEMNGNNHNHNEDQRDESDNIGYFGSNFTNLSKLNENEKTITKDLENYEFGDDVEDENDKIASLPQFPQNPPRFGHHPHSSLSMGSSIGSHSRTASSTSTFDID